MHSVTVTVPCHHPEWPRYCPTCKGIANGFYITKSDGLTLASRAGTVCSLCHSGWIEFDPKPSSDPRYNRLAPTLEECQRALRDEFWCRHAHWDIVEPEHFRYCREGPIKASAMRAITKYIDEHKMDLVLNMIHFASPVGIIAEYRHRNSAFTDTVWFSIVPLGTSEDQVTVSVLKKVDSFTCDWKDDSSVEGI